MVKVKNKEDNLNNDKSKLNTVIRDRSKKIGINYMSESDSSMCEEQLEQMMVLELVKMEAIFKSKEQISKILKKKKKFPLICFKQN